MVILLSGRKRDQGIDVKEIPWRTNVRITFPNHLTTDGTAGRRGKEEKRRGPNNESLVGHSLRLFLLFLFLSLPSVTFPRDLQIANENPKRYRDTWCIDPIVWE